MARRLAVLVLAFAAVPALAQYPTKPIQLIIPFAAVTGFVDPAVNFALQFQAQIDDDGEDTGHSSAGNDSPPAPPAPVEDGSNVVSIDFTRKK